MLKLVLALTGKPVGDFEPGIFFSFWKVNFRSYDMILFYFVICTAACTLLTCDV